jgi:hypothetical protein
MKPASGETKQERHPTLPDALMVIGETARRGLFLQGQDAYRILHETMSGAGKRGRKP